VGVELGGKLSKALEALATRDARDKEQEYVTQETRKLEKEMIQRLQRENQRGKEKEKEKEEEMDRDKKKEAARAREALAALLATHNAEKIRLGAENGGLQEGNARLEVKIASLEGKNQELSQEKLALEGKNQELSQEKLALEEEISSVRIELFHLQESSIEHDHAFGRRLLAGIPMTLEDTNDKPHSADKAASSASPLSMDFSAAGLAHVEGSLELAAKTVLEMRDRNKALEANLEDEKVKSSDEREANRARELIYEENKKLSMVELEESKCTITKLKSLLVSKEEETLVESEASSTLVESEASSTLVESEASSLSLASSEEQEQRTALVIATLTAKISSLQGELDAFREGKGKAEMQLEEALALILKSV